MIFCHSKKTEIRPTGPKHYKYKRNLTFFRLIGVTRLDRTQRFTINSPLTDGEKYDTRVPSLCLFMSMFPGSTFMCLHRIERTFPIFLVHHEIKKIFFIFNLFFQVLISYFVYITLGLTLEEVGAKLKVSKIYLSYPPLISR